MPADASAEDLVHEVAAVPAQAARLRNVLADWARHQGMPAELAEDLKLTVYEAMTNVVRHAYPAGTDNIMRITAVHRAGWITVTIADSGRWREGHRPDGGRGVPIITTFAPKSTVTSTSAGTTVSASWPLTPH
ncbi:ATP-binding protein [Amycolatopsis sp. lyj-90]|uniref:ATP-binding protein n=1 Tax=Amycolatopsis sp. lyj-90 TaxID=2789285 RepID=UPI00397CBC89